MKKTLYILLAVAVVAVWSVPAMAGITATSHELAGIDGGACAACHLPHGAVQGGQRLWPAQAVSSAAGNMVQEVAPLCAYCHHTLGGAAIGAAASDAYVWGTNSHGVLMSTSTPPYSYTDSGLEYQADASDGVLECTTCHNVHEDPTSGAGGNRPFLRAGINELCSGCHDNRRFEDGAVVGGAAALAATVSNWGASTVGLLNPGSHPVGLDINGNNTGGDTPVTLTLDELSVGFDSAVRNAWTIGGHLTGGDTGGVICTTCHSVHGVQYDADGTGLPDAGLDASPNENFLTIYQTANQTDPNGRSIANGEADYNALCEGCHSGGIVAAAYNSTSATYNNPNPGGTSYGHPVDDMDATQNWVTDGAGGFNGFPEGDPLIAGALVDPTPICESCHVAHPNANAAAGRTDEGLGDFATSDYILRDNGDDICTSCHSAAVVSNHHPVAITYNVPAGSPITYLSAITAAGDYNLACGTCHGTGSGGVHNWDSMAEVGLDPAWLPLDNGRSSTLANERYNANTSITCMDCHYGIDGDRTTKAPTLHDGLNAAYIGTNETAGVAGQYAIIGSDTGTHFIGLISKPWGTAAGGLGAQSPTGDPEADAWPLGANVISRFGGDATNTVLVCESCHDLQPGKNTGVHLLMASFVEEDAAQADSRSNMCEYCHLPPGTHPQSGDTVTRTDTTLTVDMAVAWLQTPTDTNVVMTNGTDIINCDNCHQVHDANDPSYTFILDTAAGNVAAGAADADPVSGNYTAAYVTSVLQNKGGDHQLFCDQCHPYN